MGVFWLVLAVVFGVLEAVTAQMVSVWFAIGSVFALGAYVLGADVIVQAVVFVVVSAIVLILTRPLVRKLSRNDVQKTNIDGIIGKTIVMTKSTDSYGSGGEAKTDGKFWSVASSDGQAIDEGSLVTVEKIEGVKLIVRK